MKMFILYRNVGIKAFYNTKYTNTGWSKEKFINRSIEKVREIF